jgi:salicylate hydroxylase
VIIGGGIAGLVAALSFERLGHNVRILERASRLDEAGAGIQLSPNATSILSALGVLDALLPLATIVQSIDLCEGKSGEALLALPVDHALKDAPFLSVHRADLQKVLLEAVRQKPTIRLHLDCQIQSVGKAGSARIVTFVQNDDVRSFSTPLVVGADGIRSGTRRLISAAPPEYSGFTAMRATVDLADFPQRTREVFGLPIVRAFVTAQSHLIAYPISGGRCVNLVLIAKMPLGNVAPTSSSSKFAGPVRQILSGVQEWTNWPLYTVDATKPWTDGRSVALIGDAAHALLPFAAQGAAMAIEDGFVLAQVVSKHGNNIPAALADYENSRRSRVLKVIKRTHLNRFAYHAWGPAALARNLVFKLRGPAMMNSLSWLYDYRAPGLAPDKPLRTGQEFRR